MWTFIILTIIFIIAFIFLSFIFKGIAKRVLFSVGLTLLSVILFFASFKVEGWKGFGATGITISMFVASVTALIGVVLLHQIKTFNSGDKN